MDRYMRLSLSIDGARIRWYNKKHWVGFTYSDGIFDYFGKISNCDNYRNLKELIKRDGF